MTSSVPAPSPRVIGRWSWPARRTRLISLLASVWNFMARDYSRTSPVSRRCVSTRTTVRHRKDRQPDPAHLARTSAIASDCLSTTGGGGVMTSGPQCRMKVGRW